MTNLINIEGTLFDSRTLRSADWRMIDNTFSGCYCTDIDGNYCSLKSWNDGSTEKYMLISKREE
jgi:hypothetical protein